jgi:hypothetical protein
MELIERIDLSRKQKTIDIFKIVIVCYLFVWVLSMILFKSSLSNINHTDLTSLAIPMVLYFNVVGYISADRDLFVEFHSQKIQYKTNTESGCIKLDAISKVDISIDEIRVHLKNDGIRNINISRFLNYNDRLRLNANFQSISENITHKNS